MCDRFREPDADVIVGQDFKGNDIYECEKFWEINGEKVLDDYDEIREFLADNFELKEG